MTTSSAKHSYKMFQDFNSNSTEHGFETRAIHSGSRYCEQTGAVTPPIFATSTFRSGNQAGFDYTRSGNPNFKNLEETIASLERASFATVFSSGVAAMTAVVSSLESGDVIYAEENLYGCTFRLFEQVFRKFQVSIAYIDFSKVENIEQIYLGAPRLIWLESPTNPLLKVLDIRKIAAAAERVSAEVLVDNTFASSYCQKPLALGATLSLSSTTKYLNGHSDCLGGVVCTNNSQWQDRLVFAQKALGLNPAPFDSWLTSRGIKTLALRMERHQENALEVAYYLQGREDLPLVRYPFMPSHPQYDIARSQMSGGSGIVTADFGLSLNETLARLEQLSLFTLAESLGGVESLVCHPASMTHAAVPAELRQKIGITDSLVRFSVGVEAAKDLVADIAQAFPRQNRRRDEKLSAPASISL